MKNKIYITLILILLQACSMNDHYFDLTKPGYPSMKWMYSGPPKREDGRQHDPLYVDGWKDGCETGAAALTNTFYKFFLTFKQDWQKAQDETYYKGWKEAYTYCSRYIFQYNRKQGF